ncbi:MAG TPA: hypothetical protein VEX86_05955 [Longimicrobium sp.]|nr:hypothetical protein [Longimicrobium sp.]
MRVAGLLTALLAGCLAAGCAIPRALPSPRRATRPERVASGILKQLYTLQMTYRAMHGEFAATAEALETVGWEDQGSGYYPWIVHHRRRLCVAVLPARRPLVVASIDGAGRIHRGPYCGRPW